MKLDQIRQKVSGKAISTRVDLCTLATIAEYWAGEGERFNSFSELVRLTVEEYATLLITNTSTPHITNVDKAADILQKYALLSNRQRIEHSRNYGQGLVRRDVLNRKTKGRNPAPPSPSPSSLPTVSPELFAEAQSRMEQALSKDALQRTTEAATRTQEFKDALAGPSTDETST